MSRAPTIEPDVEPGSRRDAGGSPTLGRRELAALVAAACLLSLVLHWPLPLHLGRDIPKDLGDPLTQAWQIAWGGHALLHQPLDYFQSNMFWPLRNSLAFSDALVGYAPAGTIGSGPRAAVARYDVLFLLAYALCFAGAYLLARELSAGRAGATVAGAAFAYAPWRLEQDGHMHVISSGGIPLALFLLVRGHRRERPGLVLAGWLVAAWQLALGFTLGLQLAYLLAALAAIATVGWWRRGRPSPPRPVARATAAGAVCFLLVAALLALPYLQVLHDHPEARRTAADVASFSGPLKMFAVASGESLAWGSATAGLRHSLPFVPEQTLFPGLAILALALAGLGARAAPRPLRRGLGIGILVLCVLALGFKQSWGEWLYPYRWLYAIAPGWQAIRVPGRLMTLITLGLALLAAFGAQRLLAALRARRGGAGWPVPALGALLVLVVALEGSGFRVGVSGAGAIAGPAQPTVPAAPAGQRGAPAPQLHLPLGAFDNRRYLLWSTDAFPRLVNGRGSFVPRSFTALARAVAAFPDARSVARLRALGVRTVVLHTDLAPGSPFAGWAGRPLAGLPVRLERRGAVALFALARR